MSGLQSTAKGSTGRAIRAVLVFLFLGIFPGCRSTRPAGNEAVLAPIPAGATDVVGALKAQLSAVKAIRSLMRIRVTSGGRTQSFRAQMLVDSQGQRMELDAYTPVGTAAMTLYADGNRVTFVDHLNQTAWEGTSAELAQSIGFVDPVTPLAMWALDLAGFPARGEFAVSAAGIARTTAGDTTMTFEPPSFPPRAVTVMRDDVRVEVTHLEMASTDAQPRRAEIPRGYRCCTIPRM